MLMSLPKKKKKKKKIFFFRETPTSPWVPFRAKFRPLGRLFRPIHPLAWSLNARTFAPPNQIEPNFPFLADEIAEPHPDMNIKVAAFTVSEKSINILPEDIEYWGFLGFFLMSSSSSIIYKINHFYHIKI